MANQMIALGARAPNVDPLGGAIRNNAAVINMAQQQQAMQRQNAIAEQAMQIQRAQEARAGAKAGQEATSAQVELAKNVAANFKEELNFLTPGDVQGAAALRNSVVQTIPGWNAILPTPEAIANDPTTRQRLLMKADEIIAYTVPKPQSSVSYGAGGEAFDLTHGGLGNPVARRVMVAPSGAPAPMVAPMQSNQNPEAILQSAASSKTITADEAARVQSSLGPNGGAKFNGWLQQNGIQIVPSRGGGIPPQRTAAPQTGYESKLFDDNEVGTQFRGRDPMQSPLPGSANVPLPRVRGQSAAEESGQQGVRVVTQPKIVAGEERAKRLEKLRGELPQARSEAQAVVDNLASRINAIDEFLSSKDRWSVIGPIEGNLPRIMQFGPRADMQRLWDTITNNDVLQTVLTARAQTSTGGSPLGNLSNSDLKFIVGASTPLTQTGVPEVQDQRMFKLRKALVEKLNAQKQTFDDTFRDVSAETPNIRLRLPNISPSFRPKTSSSGGGLRTGDTEIDAIMRKHGRK